jgi:hypothetical protein
LPSKLCRVVFTMSFSQFFFGLPPFLAPVSSKEIIQLIIRPVTGLDLLRVREVLGVIEIT